jgi:hypothetical protein
MDIRVVDTDAPSYLNKSPESVLMSAENEKKSKYSKACEADWHASFTPLCLSVDGLLGPELKFFLKYLAENLALKWDENYSVTIYWLKCKLSFAIIIRSTNLSKGFKD